MGLSRRAVLIVLALGAAVLATATGCGGAPGKEGKKMPRVVLVIHGGAGVLKEEEMHGEKLEDGKPLQREHYEAALAEALSAGHRVLREGRSSVEAVEAAVRVMEDSPLFNAGRGAALNHDGRAELDAAIMEGRMDVAPGERREGKKDPRKRAGAVAAVTHVKNPISAARAVMEMADHRHVLLVGPGAEAYVLSEEVADRYKIEKVSNAYFWTNRRLRQIRESIAKDPSRDRLRGDRERVPGETDRYFGTVGAVALDARGNLTAGTSTGGLTNKMAGRVGDSPCLGAGTYADNRACGVSCTGTGEVFLRHAVAHDVVARMLYKKVSVETASQETIEELPDEDEGVGGLIALDKDGHHTFAMSTKSVGMYRGYVTEDGAIYVAIYAKEAPHRMKPPARP
jgi:beta-aspartyl-peptidase (threonine type)